MKAYTGATFNRKASVVRLYEQQAGLCAYCFNRMTLALDKPNTATKEHIQPSSKGGKTNSENIVLACQSCNSRKSDKNLIDFLLQRHVG